jgi:hypothetical protein
LFLGRSTHWKGKDGSPAADKPLVLQGKHEYNFEKNFPITKYTVSLSYAHYTLIINKNKYGHQSNPDILHFTSPTSATGPSKLHRPRPQTEHTLPRILIPQLPIFLLKQTRDRTPPFPGLLLPGRILNHQDLFRSPLLPISPLTPTLTRRRDLDLRAYSLLTIPLPHRPPTPLAHDTPLFFDALFPRPIPDPLLPLPRRLRSNKLPIHTRAHALRLHLRNPAAPGIDGAEFDLGLVHQRLLHPKRIFLLLDILLHLLDDLVPAEGNDRHAHDDARADEELGTGEEGEDGGAAGFQGCDDAGRHFCQERGDFR